MRGLGDTPASMRAGPRRGAGGDLANWKTGTLGSARRGAGRVDAGPPSLRSNGMDAPARCGITCARVEVLLNHSTGRSVHDEHYEDRAGFGKERVAGARGR